MGLRFEDLYSFSAKLILTTFCSVFNLTDVFFAFTITAIILLVGRWLKYKIPLFQQLYLPSSIIAGLLALFLGPQVLGAIASSLGYSETFLGHNGLFTPAIREVWQQSPAILINLVFATLFLGEPIPTPRDIWQKAASQIAFGQTLAWGQYFTGILLSLLVLTPFFHLDPIAGTLIEIAFEGGHGTAAGMGPAFEALGFQEGTDLALGLATVGLVSGVVAGTLLTQWGRRKGYITLQDKDEDLLDLSVQIPELEPYDLRLARAKLMQNLSIDPLSLNFGFVGISVGIGWLILEFFQNIEAVTWGKNGFVLIKYIPLFPMALIGGLIVQLVVKRLGLSPMIIRPLQNHIAGLALDTLIITAFASISLSALGNNLIPFLLLSVVGITWNIFAFVFLGPNLLPTYWFERGIGDMGQSMGVTATGLLLIRMVDPHNRSGAFESFAYKQLLFAPIMGGGLFTAAAPPLINKFGSLSILILTGVLLICWLLFGLYLFKQIKNT